VRYKLLQPVHIKRYIRDPLLRKFQWFIRIRLLWLGKRLKLALEFNATTGGDLAKTNTWGLDPYTRKNVFLTLVEYELCKRPRRFCFLPLSGIKPSTQRNAIAKTAV
jgi:hypothetical protein